MLHLFTSFHINLTYSSIEEDQHYEVIKRCYWPLLKLADRYRLPLGIEATGYTLETIATIDPGWIKELRRLCLDGPCEFIGSGYAQIIGPLVPAEVNRANLEIGHEIYEKHLGFRPQIALINEQAYSAGMVRHYLDAGYQAIIMEWDNPGSTHPDWNPEWRYLPQQAKGLNNEKIPLIWNNSIAFQKFQRYAHGETDLKKYLSFLDGHCADQPRALALYGNDVEIFDFRPGRYKTEAALDKNNEWRRISLLFEALKTDQRFAIIPPSRVLDFFDNPKGGNLLRLESAGHPIPVKKQAKYNINRWALSGHDDLGINTDCWRIYRELKKKNNKEPGTWKELCYLWSSDFRTHITEKRWHNYRNRLDGLLEKISARPSAGFSRQITGPIVEAPTFLKNTPFKVQQDNNLLTIETDSQKIILNCRRGLAIHSLIYKEISKHPLLGTLPHGYFDNITYGADFYTGHLVYEIPGRHQVTDLNPVQPTIHHPGPRLVIQAEIQTDLGSVMKTLSIHPSKPEMELTYHLNWVNRPSGALRLGHLTLNPEIFKEKTLFFRTHNGGFSPETFHLNGQPVNHLSPVSPLVSANQAMGITAGLVEIGDAKKQIFVEVDKCAAAVTGQIMYTPINDKYLLRFVFSASEVDDTSRQNPDNETAPLTVSLKITGPYSSK